MNKPEACHVCGEEAGYFHEHLIRFDCGASYVKNYYEEDGWSYEDLCSNADSLLAQAKEDLRWLKHYIEYTLGIEEYGNEYTEIMQRWNLHNA